METKRLEPDWFSTGLLDLEFKQYTLLAYLQQVKDSFSRTRLYPPLADLVNHHRSLTAYRQSRSALEDSFPKQLTGFDGRTRKPIYAQPELPEAPEALSVINEVVEYSLPLVEDTLREGKALHELVEREVSMAPVGLMPMYTQEGYLLVRPGPAALTHAYRYTLSVFDQGEERLTGLHTQYVSSFYMGLAQSYPGIKLDLIRRYPELPNPATWAAECGLQFPVQETLLPVLKRKLMQQLVQPPKA